MISSSSSASLLALLSGEDEGIERQLPRAMGPTIVKIRDPLQDVELAVELLDETTPEGRRRSRQLQRKRSDGLSLDHEGNVVYNGRPCCSQLVRRLNANLHVIAIPGDFECTCGSVYRVQQAIREERQHGW